MTKKFCLYDKLFVTNRNFTIEHIKIGKNSWFFLPNFRLKKTQIPGFLRFLGEVANLMIFLT